MKPSLGVTVISSRSTSPRIVTDAGEEGVQEARAWVRNQLEYYIVYAPRTLPWNYGTEALARFLPAAKRRKKAERDEEWFIHEHERDRWADAVDYAQAAARENPELVMHIVAVVEGGDVLLLALAKGWTAVRATRDATRGARWTDGWGNNHWETDWYDYDPPRVVKLCLIAKKNRLASGGIV
jgi:predicted SnoaL-like aldol condensation-catalyzing enzyme